MRIHDLLSRPRPWIGALAVLCLALGHRQALAGTALSEIRYGADITIRLQPGDSTLPAGSVGRDMLAGFGGLVTLGPLPAGAQVSSYHLRADGSQLLSFATTISLPGAGVVEPRDVVRLASGAAQYSVELRGSDRQIPRGTAIDALTENGAGQLVLSLDVSANGADDEDLLRLDGDNLVLFFDGSAAGVPVALDLDAAALIDGTLFVSFDGSGTVAGGAIAFDDEDVLAYDLAAQSWMLAYDGGAAAAAWPVSADLSALHVLAAAASTPTHTAVPTFTSTSVFTATNTPAPPATFTPPPSPSQTPSAIFTATPTVTASPSSTATGVSTTTPTPSPSASATVTAGASCVGDCSGDGLVTVDEVVTMVNVALGNTPVESCLAADASGDGQVTVDEILTAVTRALNGCP